jgi:hypothetical protein
VEFTRGGFGAAMARAEGFEEHFDGVEEVSSHGCGIWARLEDEDVWSAMSEEWDWVELVGSIEDGEMIEKKKLQRWIAVD